MNLVERIEHWTSDLPGFGRGNRKPLLALLVALCFLAGGFALPRALGFFYQLKGARILAGVMQAGGKYNSSAIPCVPTLRSQSRLRERAQHAIRELGKSLAYQPSSGYTHLLLGRANCLVGDYQAAIKPYRNYIRSSPQNPLGYIELGFVYSNLDRDASAIRFWRKAMHKKLDLLNISLAYLSAGDREQSIKWRLKHEWQTENYKDGDQREISGGGAIIESFSENLETWQVCSWCKATGGEKRVQDGSLVIQCQMDANGRCSNSARKITDVSVTENFTGSLKISGDIGALFTMEIVTDGKRERVFNVRAVKSAWEIWKFPIKGDRLEEILITVSNKTSVDKSSQINLDWICIE